jgi:hypothetical protein
VISSIAKQNRTGHAMNVNRIVNKTINLVTPQMHKVRRASLTRCMRSLLNEAKASVTGMGLGISSSAYEKHRIKQADRLLSNKHIAATMHTTIVLGALLMQLLK